MREEEIGLRDFKEEGFKLLVLEVLVPHQVVAESQANAVPQLRDVVLQVVAQKAVGAEVGVDPAALQVGNHVFVVVEVD